MARPYHTMPKVELRSELRRRGQEPGIGLSVRQLVERLEALDAAGEVLDAGQMLLLLRDHTGTDATVHTISGYDPPNEFCVHPDSDPEREFRAPTLEEACTKALEWALGQPTNEETPR